MRRILTVMTHGYIVQPFAGPLQAEVLRMGSGQGQYVN
jgi:hypothetical protein